MFILTPPRIFLSINIRPKFAKWQAVQQAKARKEDAAEKKRYARIAEEENKIREEIERRGPQPWSVSEYIGLAFVLAYVFYLADLASLLVGGKLFW